MAAEHDEPGGEGEVAPEALELGAAPGRGSHRRHTVRALAIAVAMGVLALLVSWNGHDEPSVDEDTASSPLDVDAEKNGVALDDATSTSGDTASTSTTISASDAETTTSVSGHPDPGPDESPSPAPAPTTSGPTTTICANSFDPDCGPFRWNKAVGTNHPVEVSIELLTDDPVVGELIEFRVRVSDPDATPIGVGSPWKGPVGHDHQLTPGNCYWHGVDEGFGPWTPPTPRPGSVDTVTGSRVLEPGTVRFTFCIATMSWERYPGGASDEEVHTWCPGDPNTLGFEGFTCRDPYGSFGAPYIDVVVADAP